MSINIETIDPQRVIEGGYSEAELEAFLLSLTKEQLGVIEKPILERLRRSRDERIRYYKPYDDPGYQLDFHKSKKKKRNALGTNMSGKSTVGKMEIEWWATGTHPYRETPSPPCYMRVCCTDFTSGIDKIWLEGLKKVCIRDGLLGGSFDTAFSAKKRTLYWKSGSFVEFMSYKQDVEDYGGTARHLIIEDEPCPEDIHRENMARLVDYGGELIRTFTPVNLRDRTVYLYDEWLESVGNSKSDQDWFQFDLRKNKALSQEEVVKFIKQFENNEEERIARTEGRFPQLTGLVFKGFSPHIHVIEPFDLPDHWTTYIGIDPHTRERTAVLFMVVDPEGNHYVWDELFEAGRAKMLVEIIKYKLGQRKLQKAVMDNSAKDPNVIIGKRVWDEFVDPDGDGSNRGIYAFTVSNKQKDIMGGIRSIEGLLGLDAVYHKPKLFVFKNCPMVIKEFQTFSWKDYRNKTQNPPPEKVNKKGIHLLDCLRYMLMHGVGYVKLRGAEENKYENPFGYLSGGYKK